MSKELELWHFVHAHLADGQNVMLLVVTSSSGSSPGRRGYKLAVSSDGELCGSIGGGVMEVALVEKSRTLLSGPGAKATGFSEVVEQVHQKNSPNASGMICSGRQTVLLKQLSSADSDPVDSVVAAITNNDPTASLVIADRQFGVIADSHVLSDDAEKAFYTEKIGIGNELFIVGGGHCALALSELMSKLDFRISIFDDRPELNTIEKNQFAQAITIIDSYEQIDEFVPSGPNNYVVVMTLGYRFDEVVVRRLIDRDFKYFGVLGSRAKMATMFRELERDGSPRERLAAIHTPIGLPINSHSPEEIAVSIAAEIIQVKNA